MKEPGEVIEFVNEFYSMISEIDENIDKVIDINDELLPQALLNFYDKLLKLRKLVLIQDVNRILNDNYENDLKHKIEIMSDISSDLSNKYNIISQSNNQRTQIEAHKDSLKLTCVIIFLALITLWMNLFETNAYYTFGNYDIRFDVYVIPIIISILILVYLYHKQSKIIYIYPNNNFDAGLHPYP